MLRLEKVQSLLKKRKTIGRGGSRGGTSGKGTKGQKARSGGGVRPGYEGGQMPLARRLPKRGFNNSDFKRSVEIVALARIAQSFDGGSTVTIDDLISKNLIEAKKSKGGTNKVFVKVLGNDELKKKLIICANAFSKSASKRIQDSGGEARLVEEI